MPHDERAPAEYPALDRTPMPAPSNREELLKALDGRNVFLIEAQRRGQITGLWVKVMGHLQGYLWMTLFHPNGGIDICLPLANLRLCTPAGPQDDVDPIVIYEPNGPFNRRL